MIGVLPEAQGKGLASALMNPIIQRMKEKAIPVFRETANPRNVDIYKKKGFKIFETLTIGDHRLFLMSTECAYSPLARAVCLAGVTLCDPSNLVLLSRCQPHPELQAYSQTLQNKPKRNSDMGWRLEKPAKCENARSSELAFGLIALSRIR